MSYNKDPKLIVFHLIDHYIHRGIADKTDIYSKIVEQTGLKRPEVRKYARQYRIVLLDQVKILEAKGSKPIKKTG